ncbi:MAG: ATP-grasp domain-containing protein, partial [Sarcina sp.]
MRINILILSAGRRVELVKLFKEAAKLANVDSKVVTADISNSAPATYFSDKNYIIPRIGDSGYLESILGICKEEKINLVIPTIDTELIPLTNYKEVIEENTYARVLISDKRVIDICRDKIKSNKFFEENGFGVPREISLEDISNKNY